jgi:hypothetical protein
MLIPVAKAFTGAHALQTPLQQRRARLSPLMAHAKGMPEKFVGG